MKAVIDFPTEPITYIEFFRPSSDELDTTVTYGYRFAKARHQKFTDENGAESFVTQDNSLRLYFDTVEEADYFFRESWGVPVWKPVPKQDKVVIKETTYDGKEIDSQ